MPLYSPNGHNLVYGIVNGHVVIYAGSGCCCGPVNYGCGDTSHWPATVVERLYRPDGTLYETTTLTFNASGYSGMYVGTASDGVSFIRFYCYAGSFVLTRNNPYSATNTWNSTYMFFGPQVEASGDLGGWTLSVQDH